VEETKEAVLIDDVQVDERAVAELSRVDRELRSVLVSPILARGEMIGAIHLDSRLVGGLFTKEDLRVMELIGGQAGISIENARLYRLAVLDGMTRLYNRTFLEHSLIQGIAAARRYNKKLCVVMTDIDRFKQINDTLGHAAGDAIIQGVADVIRNTVRKSDLAARYGGDVFVIVLQETDEDQGSVVAENIRALVQEIRLPAQDLDANQMVISISLGLAEFCGTDDAAALIAKADTALYKSKAQGGNRVSTWEEGDQLLSKKILPR
jgi:diguanylate cyclase (GGDEF)-like protein